MTIVFPIILDHEPYKQKKVLVRIPDDNEPNGYATIRAVQFNTNLAATLSFGSLELIQVEPTEDENTVLFVASTPPLVFEMHEGVYWQKLLHDANTLSFAEFVQVHRDLFFQ